MVVSMDVRRSTLMRRGVSNPLLFEGTILNFFEGARHHLQAIGLWFDKFLGDGLLAYGPVGPDGRHGAVPLALLLVCLGELSAIFDAASLRVLRELGCECPSDAGIATGLDGGKVTLWPMHGGVELQGDVVVSATRMQSVASGGEIVASAQVGATIEHFRGRYLPKGMTLESQRRATKDEADGVAVYAMRYLPRPIFGPRGEVTGWEAP
jgi:class 3 adenylate cyclase